MICKKLMLSKFLLMVTIIYNIQYMIELNKQLYPCNYYFNLVNFYIDYFYKTIKFSPYIHFQNNFNIHKNNTFVKLLNQSVSLHPLKNKTQLKTTSTNLFYYNKFNLGISIQWFFSYIYSM